MDCNYCKDPMVITSQNLDAKFCGQPCYNAWRIENPSTKPPKPKDSIPTGNLPLFV